MKKITGSIGGW